jgi:hypothetical protein
MRSNDIDPLRYRSAVLGHAFLLAKEKGVRLKDLPGVMLERLGISVREGRCTTFDVRVPAGIGAKAIVRRMERFEQEMRKAMPKEAWKGSKTSRQKQRDVREPVEGEGMASMEIAGMVEGLRGTLNRLGAGIEDKG